MPLDTWTANRVSLALGLAFALATGLGKAADTGIVALRTLEPALLGSNVIVGQVEAGNPAWEVNPAAVGQPVSRFTWTSASGSTNNFPNAVGFESDHANQVGTNFYGASTGVAPGVQRVDVFEVNYFIQSVVAG